MRLSKIKLSGFKTFVDPTTIKFPSNLMGIVGPNGCGKSNVIDGIRWVLGEASAKTLRGESMADVIFNGSVNRKPVGVASIELVFDNSDGTIAGPYAGYAEVAVRRVVSRDGTSQYYLNNARCRRKDITHILLGTGLGSHGYSIIEQGMISRLVEAKPEELRAFLEEAAGISKYKERRRETENRMQHTRENLERLADLREEVEKQLTHLQRQAKDAERYKTLRADQRKVNAELLALRLMALRNEVTTQEQQFKEKQLALEAAVTVQRSAETQIEKLRVELAERNERFNEIQGSYYRVGSDISRLEQSIQHRKDLMQRQREDLHGTEEQITELKSHIESDQVELEQLDQLLSELGPGLEQAYNAQRTSRQAFDEAERAMEQWRTRWEQINEELASTERAKHVEEARLEQLAAQAQRLEKERQKQTQERAALSFGDLERQLETLVAAEERLAAACANATNALDTVAREIQQLRDQEKKLSGHLDQLRGQVQTDRGRLTSLEALQEAALGKSSEHVNRWLTERNLAERRRLAQQLVVERGWERAVETVLGSYLQAVSVESIDRVVQHLPELAEGGVTLLEDRMAEPRQPAAELLLARVKAPAAVADLLSGVRVADSLMSAIQLRNTLEEGESLVTREGFWIGREWVRINRTDDPQAGVIARGEEIEKLRGSVSAASRRVEEIAKALSDTRHRLERLEETRAAAQTEANRRQQLYSETKAKVAACRTELEQNRARASTLDNAIAELAAEQQSLVGAQEESRVRSEAATNRHAALQADREECDRQRRDHQDRLSVAKAKAEEQRELTQAMAIQVESRRSSKESASAALTRIQTQLNHLLRRQRELENEIESAAEPLKSDEELLVTKLDERLGVENNLTASRTGVEETDGQLRQAEHERTAAQQNVNELRDAADTVRLSVREAQVRAETVVEQFAETGYELDTLVAELPPDATAAAWHETFEQIERRIQRLGAINLAAIDEFQAQSERKTYLDAQFTDLTEALETLENAIRKIDRETRSRFQETFEKANQWLGRHSGWHRSEPA